MTSVWPHRIEVMLSASLGFVVRGVCVAPEGSPCRMWCEHQCESIEDYEHEDGTMVPHEHPIVDLGACMAMDWFNNMPIDEIVDAYEGQTRVAKNGEISIFFWGDYVTWVYREDDPRAVPDIINS